MNAPLSRLTESSRTSPRIGIALGAGGARGLAHIAVLEALDELGMRPAAISGASMGAILGAPYAAGMEARQVSAHVLAMTRNRSSLLSKLLRARVGRFTDLIFKGRGNPVLLDGLTCLDLFWPQDMPDEFESLKTPLFVVATDFHACTEVIFSKGLLAPPVAASMGLPGLFRPVDFAGRILVDGGAVNPLPYDVLFDCAEIVIAVDVTFGGRMRERRMPTPFGAMIGAAQIMQGAITAQKIKARPPDILLQPPVGAFSVLDFWRAPQILRAAEAVKDTLKRDLMLKLEALTRT